MVEWCEYDDANCRRMILIGNYAIKRNALALPWRACNTSSVLHLTNFQFAYDALNCTRDFPGGNSFCVSRENKRKPRPPKPPQPAEEISCCRRDVCRNVVASSAIVPRASSFFVARCRRRRATPPSSSREGWCGDDRHRRRALRPVLLAVDDVDAQSPPPSTKLTTLTRMRDGASERRRLVIDGIV